MKSFLKFLRSFVIGFSGLAFAIRTEQNMRIHVVIAMCVIVVGFVVHLERWEWVAVLLCIGLVISAECLNTAIERLADRVSLELSPLIKQAKDCASAAVLVIALMAAVIGGLIFLPKFWVLWGG